MKSQDYDNRINFTVSAFSSTQQVKSYIESCNFKNNTYFNINIDVGSINSDTCCIVKYVLENIPKCDNITMDFVDVKSKNNIDDIVQMVHIFSESEQISLINYNRLNNCDVLQCKHFNCNYDYD